MNQPRPLTALLLALTLSPSSFVLTAAAADRVPEVLVAFRGAPLLLEFPAVRDLGTTITVPAATGAKKWGSLQVSASNVTEVAAYFGVAPIPSVLYLDEYGNLIFRDTRRDCRRRVSAGITDFSRRVKDIEDGLRRRLGELEDARAKGRSAKEVEILVALVGSRIHGYPAIEVARARYLAVDDARRRSLIEILAGEGIVSRKRLDQALKSLAQISNGLPVAEQIRGERRRLQKGARVEEREG